MITLTISNNNKLKISGPLKEANLIYENMKVRHPSAFYLRPHMEKGWDGKIKYITDAGYARLGLLPLITRKLTKLNIDYILVDHRNTLEVNEKLPKFDGFDVRPYQLEAVNAIVKNEVDGVPFNRGIIDAATNAGKTLIAAYLHYSFKGIKTIVLVNNAPLFKQFLEDFPKFFGDNWGYMQGKNIKWGDIMVCMVPTLNNRLDEYKRELSQYSSVLFDECHLASSKTSKRVISNLFNTVVRVGLSGTPLLHKDPTKNMDIMAFFGDVVYKITNRELMDMGYSTPVKVKMLLGNLDIKYVGDYDREYEEGIISNKDREKRILNRISFYLHRSKYPILIIGRYHRHIERFYKKCKREFGSSYRIAYIHGKVKDRYEILARYKEGDIDILIASYLIKLGQNMPRIRVMINMAGGDSHINAIQIIGRLIRKHDSKKKVIYEDFYDEGAYLKRHSKHRIMYYKKEKYPVLELYKRGK